MAKIGLTLDKLGLLVPEGKSWSICIGAGCSRPVFPVWRDLSIKLASQVNKISSQTQDELLEKLSPEVIIQYAFEKSKRTPEEFADLLSETLYENLFQSLSPSDKKLAIKCLTTQTPNPHYDWIKYIDIINSVGHPTSLQLAEFVVDAYQKGKNIESIISFNAELLLSSLINAYAQLKLKTNLKIIDYVTEPISSHYKNRIAYIFCHGLVKVPQSSISAQKKFNATDKLVFSENEYLQLANASYSWQYSSFINTLSTNTVFFIGLSFTDPNIRRWLAWLHDCRKKSIERYGVKGDSTAHYWIEKVPKSPELKSWHEASVAHLGVRIIWINEWDEVKEVMERAVGL